MSGSKPRYLLDANVFIEAKNRYYAFDICPGFWRALIVHHQTKRVFSIQPVRAELVEQQDELSKWAKETCPATFFKETQDQAVIDQFGEQMKWAYDQDFTAEAKSEFADAADGWVIAYAKVNGMTLVTHEEYAPEARRHIKIPNVCLEFDVPCVNTFEMLRELGVKLLIPKRRKG